MGSPKVQGGMTYAEQQKLMEEERVFQEKQEEERRQRAIKDEEERRQRDELERNRLKAEETQRLFEANKAEQEAIYASKPKNEAEGKDGKLIIDFYNSLYGGISKPPLTVSQSQTSGTQQVATATPVINPNVESKGARPK